MMTNEERNTSLYQKMFAEQEKFRDWLKGQPPEEILNHAYEYTVREDILAEPHRVFRNFPRKHTNRNNHRFILLPPE